MSLLRHIKASSDTTKLPDPRGPLSTTVPLSSIESANTEVKRMIKTEESESSDAVRDGVNQVLWTEQFWNGHPQKLDHEIFEDRLFVKIGPHEKFPLYGSSTVAWCTKLIIIVYMYTTSRVRTWRCGSHQLNNNIWSNSAATF